MRPLAIMLMVAGCGGAKWTTEDATSATDLANAALSLEAICDRDGGVCPAPAVRAIERGTYCASVAMLYRHQEPVPEAGTVKCTR